MILSYIIFIFRGHSPTLYEIASYTTECVLRVSVPAILNGLMHRIMHFENDFVVSYSHYPHLTLFYFPRSASHLPLTLPLSLPFSPFLSVTVSLCLSRSLMWSQLCPSNGYQLVDLPCQPRSCGCEASELSWQTITF